MEEEESDEGDLEPTDSAAFGLTALTSSVKGNLSTGEGDLDFCKGEGDFSKVDSIRIGENFFNVLTGLFSIVLCIGEGPLSNLALISMGDIDLDLESRSRKFCALFNLDWLLSWSAVLRSTPAINCLASLTRFSFFFASATIVSAPTDCLVLKSEIKYMSCNVRKRTFWHVCPTKFQISLHIHTVWSESSLSTWRNFAFLAYSW